MFVVSWRRAHASAGKLERVPPAGLKVEKRRSLLLAQVHLGLGLEFAFERPRIAEFQAVQLLDLSAKGGDQNGVAALRNYPDGALRLAYGVDLDIKFLNDLAGYGRAWVFPHARRDELNGIISRFGAGEGLVSDELLGLVLDYVLFGHSCGVIVLKHKLSFLICSLLGGGHLTRECRSAATVRPEWSGR